MSKLFCDCKTDEEKSNFFLSGQGVETGIIAPAISNEVAMAFHRCFELEKQLAAAVAACKQKDEAIEGLIDTMDLRLDDDDLSLETRTAFEALAIQPDDAALKAWLGPHACEAIAKSGAPARWWWSDYGLSLPVGTKLYSPKGLVEK